MEIEEALARRALTEPGGERAGVAESKVFYRFRPLPAGDRVVSHETVERLREDEAV